MRPILVLALTLACLLGCSRIDDPQLSKKERLRFRASYIELARFYERHAKEKTVPADSIQTLCAKHGLDRETYERALAWTSAKPKRWRTFYRKVSEALNAPPPAPAPSSSKSGEAAPR